MTNKQKRITAFALMVVVMICIATIDISLYKNLLMLFGAWQVGRWVGDWARAMWPDNEKDT